MSWYVGQDGRKVWVENSETVYTVGEPEEELPLETLTYLAVNSHKPVFQENIINEDTGKKTKKAKEGAAGRQRGFVVRVEQEDKGRVVATFRAAAEKLLASGIVSRYDVDESSTGSKKKRGKKEEEEEPDVRDRMRKKVRTIARMARMFKTLRQENETVIRLKGVCPGHKLAPGLLLAGKDRMNSELEMFGHVAGIDAVNEKRPELSGESGGQGGGKSGKGFLSDDEGQDAASSASDGAGGS
mmetsp:Transcript_102123/g.317677  ORF Transcript_102123/g.317677 Transcript_102123/m.317677 type:complete len:242 (+) Transcript_102123:116-841(+)